jgi:SHS2 domain-containing protein
MGTFEFIEHTADKGFRAEGIDLQDLFETSVRGMAKLLREDLPLDSEELPQSHRLNIQAQDETALLVDFLSEILTLSHIHKTVFIRADIEEINPERVRAVIRGTEVEYFDEVIKAVTYHQAGIHKDDQDKIATNIIFDI